MTRDTYGTQRGTGAQAEQNCAAEVSRPAREVREGKQPRHHTTNSATDKSQAGALGAPKGMQRQPPAACIASETTVLDTHNKHAITPVANRTCCTSRPRAQTSVVMSTREAPLLRRRHKVLLGRCRVALRQNRTICRRGQAVTRRHRPSSTRRYDTSDKLRWNGCFKRKEARPPHSPINCPCVNHHSCCCCCSAELRRS